MTPIQTLVRNATKKYAAAPPTVKAPAPTGGALGPTPKLSTGGAPSLGASPAKLSTPAIGGAAGPKPLVPTAPKAPTAPLAAPAQPAAPKPAAPVAPAPTLQPQPAQPQGAAQPAAGPRRPFDDDFVPSLQSAPKEQQPQIAQQAVQQHMQSQPPAIQKGLQDIHAGNDTTEAQQFSQQVDAKGQEVMKADVAAQAAAHPELSATPQGFGQMWNQASEAWNGMPQEAKWMVGLGVPMAAVGLMSSLFGGGGAGMGMLGLLGLGAAGLGGAAGGLFGQGAANMSADAMYNIGTFTGMMPEKADLSRLKGTDPMAAMGNGPVGTREEVAKQIADGKEQMGQLRQLMSLPVGEETKMRLMQRLDPSLDTPEAVQQAYQNAGTMIQQYDDPESELNKKMQEGQNYADSTGIKGLAMEHVGRYLPDWITGKKGSANTPVLNLIEKWAFNDMDAKELLDLEKAQSQKYDLKNARRLEELKKRKLADAPVDVVGTCMKAARCWAGYEPVLGKKPYSNDSCRPAGSKKKKKTTEKK